MLIVVVWIAGAIMVSMVAGQKGRSRARGFWISLLVSPLITFCYYLAVPNLNAANASGGGFVRSTRGRAWRCGDCGAENTLEVSACPFCSATRSGVQREDGPAR